MSYRVSGMLFPILVVIAFTAMHAPARATDADLYAQGRFFAIDGQTDSPQHQAAESRIYVPLHPAKPQEIGKEFAPIQATPFGQARAGPPGNTAAPESPKSGADIPVDPRTGKELPGYSLGGIY